MKLFMLAIGSMSRHLATQSELALLKRVAEQLDFFAVYARSKSRRWMDRSLVYMQAKPSLEDLRVSWASLHEFFY